MSRRHGARGTMARWPLLAAWLAVVLAVWLVYLVYRVAAHVRAWPF